MDQKILDKYDKLIALCDGFERKGKSLPYTSANGHMFSQINQEGELGLRFSAEQQKKYMEEWNTSSFISYGRTMQGYVRVPDELWNDFNQLARYLRESHHYVQSLKPK